MMRDYGAAGKAVVALIVTLALSGCALFRSAKVPAPPRPEPEPITTLSSAPATPSARDLGRRCFGPGHQLRHVERWLKRNLDRRQYPHRTMLAPGGFAIATAFERVGEDGQTIARKRFDTGPFEATFWNVYNGDAQPGHYRAFLFVFAPNMPMHGNTPTFDTAQQEFGGNAYELPGGLAARPVAPGQHLQVFAYEYVRTTFGGPARRPQSYLGVGQHLAGAGLAPIVNGACP